MKKYNKLVRDKIPEIMLNDGERPKVRKLNRTDYKKELLKKLEEESKEVKKIKDKKELIEELADIHEVVSAIYDAYKISYSEVTKVAIEKRKKKGAFKDKVFLEHTK